MARTELLSQTCKPRAVSRIVLGDVWRTEIRNCASYDAVTLMFGLTLYKHNSICDPRNHLDLFIFCFCVRLDWFLYGASLGAMRQRALVRTMPDPSLPHPFAHSYFNPLPTLLPLPPAHSHTHTLPLTLILHHAPQSQPTMFSSCFRFDHHEL